jgi:protein TonB
MFEQTTAAIPASHRLFGTLAGVTCQAVLVGSLILVPLIFPQALPDVRSLVFLVAPGPPPPPPAPGPVVRPRPATTLRVFCLLCAPVVIPKQIATLVDEEPVEIASGTGVPGGVPGGMPNGVPGGLPTSILAAVPAPLPPPQIVTPPSPIAAAPAVVQRITGGIVKMANPIHRVEPIYPPIAKQARVQGTVEIEGVIGVDGRMREVHVKSGPALLVKAALDAVKQWVYEPSTLNGNPVEVAGIIIVTFRLMN